LERRGRFSLGSTRRSGRVIRRLSRTPVVAETLADLEDEIEPLSAEDRTEAVALVLAELEKEQAH
jgi:hypothetical protein